jgi:sugar phosphate isomerase/epimerase
MKFPFLILTTVAALFLAGCASTPTVGTGKSFKGPVGLQLYSLRAQFTRNVLQGLELTKSFGIRDVELAGTYNQRPELFRETLRAAGLNPVSGHFSYDRYRDDPEGVAEEAKKLGLKYAGVAWIPHQGDFDEKTARAAAAVFNHAGEVLAKHGIRFFYHVHGYEFYPHGGGTLLDLLFAETNPKYVTYQMDVLWVVFPGQDPVQWLKRYPDRWELLHLKDLKKGVRTGSLSGSTDVNNDVALGTGQMDWPAILKQAKKNGVKYYFIEDESARVAEQIPQTLRYLEQVSW